MTSTRTLLVAMLFVAALLPAVANAAASNRITPPAAVAVDASAGSIDIELTRVDPVSVTRVDFATTPANPALGHYVGTTGTVTFEDGQSIAELSIPIPQDGIVGTTEQVTITLAPGDSDLGGDPELLGTEIVVTITNDVPALAPSATIAMPADGQVVQLGSTVATSFSCSEGLRGTGIASCIDSRGATGGAGTLDTSVIGARAYTVTATSTTGLSASSTISYVVQAPPVPDTLAPSAPMLLRHAPSRTRFVRIKGIVEAGAMVQLFTSANCTGSPRATGTAAALDGAGLRVLLAANASTTLRAKAIDAAGNVSRCGAPRTFVVDTIVPTTRIAVRPRPITDARRSGFRFASSERATFQCRIDTTPWRACASTWSIAVRPGVHVLRVRAVDAAGNVDRTPAFNSWRVVASGSSS